MLKHNFIPKGLVKKLTKEIGDNSFVSQFDLEDWFKRTAIYYGLQIFDPCCDTVAAPTSPVVDDTANTFNFTYATGFTSLADYEQTLNGGTTYTALSAKPITGLTGARAINTVGVRVKALGARPASSTLFNNVAYTV